LKDLKHLIFFEDLLLEANNKLIQQATEPSAQAVTQLEEDISAMQTRRRQPERSGSRRAGR